MARLFSPLSRPMFTFILAATSSGRTTEAKAEEVTYYKWTESYREEAGWGGGEGQTLDSKNSI